ncbi:hypothetical protein ACOME3_004287 [Neoechinorhynchus agilis]
MLFILVLLQLINANQVRKCSKLFHVRDSAFIKCGNEDYSRNGLYEVFNEFEKRQVLKLFLFQVSIEEVQFEVNKIFPNLHELSIVDYAEKCSNVTLDFAESIEILHLENMNIESIGAKKILILKEMYVKGSFVSHLRTDLGQKLPLLQRLDLEGNALITLDEFREFCFLKELNIDDNKLNALHFTRQNCFHELTKITALNNPIQYLEIEDGADLTNLREIKFSLNGPIASEMNQLQKVSSIEKVTIKRSLNRKFDASRLKNLSNLKALELIDGNLIVFPRGGRLTNLTIHNISVAFNLIGTVRKNDFKLWQRLKWLDLSSNLLQTIPNNAFSLLKDLQVLNLIGNNLPERNFTFSISPYYTNVLFVVNNGTYDFLNPDILPDAVSPSGKNKKHDYRFGIGR